MLNFHSAFVNKNEIFGPKPLKKFSGFVIYTYKTKTNTTMATRSMIWVKINSEDFGKTMICDVNRLHGGLMEFNYPLQEYTIPTPMEDDHGNLWLGAYCHWDGYPEGVGAELKEHYNTYEDILNLILLGQLSYICGEVCAYHNWRDEDHIISVDKNELPSGSDYIDYTYYFEDGEWTYVEWDYNKHRVNLD